MDHIRYSPLQEEIEHIKLHYWEVWQGIPELEYQKAKSESGEALRYDKEGHYIWVSTTALNAYKSNSETIYLVMKNKTGNGKIMAIWLEPKSESLENVINAAKELNKNEIEKTIKSRKQKNYPLKTCISNFP